MGKGKRLYRMESLDKTNGLWYNGYGEYVFGIGEIEHCETKDLPMGYDERYLQDGKNWFSACSRKEDLKDWFSLDDAKELLERGFKFYTYLATDYIEYENETLFLKETVLEKVEIDIFELLDKVNG